MTHDALQRLVDRAEIQDCLCRYARGVDRGDWALVRSSYHPDAYDQHGEYRGGIDGLIAWLDARFAAVDNSTHFLGNCLIEFAGARHAFAETYFVSRRLRLPTPAERARHPGLQPQDRMCREAWGRYADRFERRDGAWRVSHRTVVLESAGTSLAIDGARAPGAAVTWGSRDASDPACRSRAQWFAQAAHHNPSPTNARSDP